MIKDLFGRLPAQYFWSAIAVVIVLTLAIWFDLTGIDCTGKWMKVSGEGLGFQNMTTYLSLGADGDALSSIEDAHILSVGSWHRRAGTLYELAFEDGGHPYENVTARIGLRTLIIEGIITDSVDAGVYTELDSGEHFRDQYVRVE